MLTNLAAQLLDRGLVPDRLLHPVLLRQIRAHLSTRKREYCPEAILQTLEDSPLFAATVQVNQQLYEVPTAFWALLLGPRLKFSCCLFEEETNDLTRAEEAMLRLTCERAEIEDGMTVLELGCGWGALAFYIAEQFPNCRVKAVTNSRTQFEHIQKRAAETGTDGVQVLLQDISALELEERFDRILGIEVLEHARNYRKLLTRLGQWLTPSGKVFLHHVCHSEIAYIIENGGNGWMARHFAAGCTMPSYTFLDNYSDIFVREESWMIPGRHFAATFRAWRQRLHQNFSEARDILSASMGRPEAKRAVNRWSTYLLAAGATFEVNQGNEFFVAHHRITPSTFSER